MLVFFVANQKKYAKYYKHYILWL